MKLETRNSKLTYRGYLINNTPKSKDIRSLLKNGRKTGNEFFSVFLRDNGGEARLFTANIAKKNLKKSTDRNRYKRWIRAVFHKHKGLFKNTDVLIMPRPGMSRLPDFAAIERALMPLFPEKKG